MISCYCNSGKIFENCCEPYITGIAKPLTAEDLMRSRFSAYCVQAIDYLITTTHISTRKFHSKTETQAFASQNQWVSLEILRASESIVEFRAHYLDSQSIAQVHHEKSYFLKEAEEWYYVNGEWL